MAANTAHALAKSTLFPAQLVPDFLNKVKGHSSLAAMNGGEPVKFNGNTYFTFNFDNEVDIVAEAGAKSHGGGTVAPITITPIKIEYGMRVSDEFDLASEEEKLDYLRQFAEGWSKKVARGLDIMALHGKNPRTGSTSSIIGTNNFDSQLTTAGRVVSYSGSDPDGEIEEAVGLVLAAENEVSGAILGPTIRAALSTLKTTNGDKVYPELAWGGKPDRLNGLKVDFNTTVETGNEDAKAYLGDFAEYFKWGIAKEMPIEVIRYGNPDNDATAGDLKGHNQIYLRGEAYIGWAIMDINAFAKIEETD